MVPVHVPAAFAEERLEAIAAAVRAAMIGEVITLGAHGLQATPIPMLLEPGDEYGSLVGHMSRANPQWRDFDPAVEALVVFRPADAYVSPSLYASKAEHGRVVPTWNYLTVHAWGPLVVHDDRAWVGDLVRRLTDQHEALRPQPWSVNDAPGEFVEAQLRAIVGIEIPVSRLQAKAKLSQNRPQSDIGGVIAGLSGGRDSDRRVADAMRERFPQIAER
ncbi:MAG: FMN-binding negative transcriptional regulator [Candidatus Dormibacteria bacterium]